MRNYVSVGRGGPRFGVIMSPLEVLAAVAFVAIPNLIIAALGAAGAAFGTLTDGEQGAIALSLTVIMLWASRRAGRRVPQPQSAEEREEAFQAARAEFFRGGTN
jgi:membrane protein implicated in regulation of membrane protease activity